MGYHKVFTKKDAEDFNLPLDDHVIGKIVYVHEKKDGPITEEKIVKGLGKVFDINRHLKNK